MEKAIEIKRRAQRCIQNGDLDGALNEYEKLVQVQDSDPYNFVLLADLLFKRGDSDQAVQRYLAAVASYEKAGLFKNAIAVCKKMMRLSLAPAKVLERLAALHALDGLGTEAALYYMQYAETLVRDSRPKEAADALQRAFDASPDEVKPLERMSEAWMLADDTAQAARAMGAAAYAYERLGRLDNADRCRRRAEQLRAGTMDELAATRGALRPPIEEPMPPLAPGLAQHASSAEDEGAFVDDATATSDSDRIEGLVSPMAPTFPSQHLPHTDLELERRPSRIPGATESDGPPRFVVEETESTEAEAEWEPHGPPRLPNANHHGPEVAESSSFETEPGDEPSSSVYDLDAEPEAEPAAYALADDASADAPEAYAVDEPQPDAVAAPATAYGDAPAQLTIAEIEALLSGAQEKFRTGDREGAATLLVEAALAYERSERLENAASIFRSLARGPQTSTYLLELWLANCERRHDSREAAEVSCELGDRALNDGDRAVSRAWFERACEHDPDNAVAQRRLSRLAELTADAPAPAPAMASHEAVAEPAGAAGTDAGSEPTGEGRVEMSVGRAEAVSFDLGALLSEFQRGIEAQLSGDAQSHYDLAMTYREMGLHTQAVDGFRLAAADPAFAFRAAEMIGRCLLDQGRFDEAVHEFAEALRSPKLTPEAVLGLRYQLGLAHEAAGDLNGALAEFERVFEQQANYSDVALKLRALRTSLGQA